MITITQRPFLVTPSDNPIYWQVESDNPNIVGFELTVMDATGAYTIDRLSLRILPDVPGSYVDLSKLLTNLVTGEVNLDTSNPVVMLERPLKGYTLSWTEKVLSGGVIVDGDTLYDPTDVSYVFNAQLDTISFHHYQYPDLVVSMDGYNKRFLTNKPDKGEVNNFTTEHLYFICRKEEVVLYPGQSHYYVNLIVYDTDGTILNTYADPIEVTADLSMFRMDVSPKNLESKGITWLDGMSYDVFIVDLNGETRTETRRYVYREIPCNLEVTNVLWANVLGGVDSYTFVNPQETMSLDRNRMRKNTWRPHDGLITNVRDGIFNTAEETISNRPSVSVLVHSRILTDDEAKWLAELAASKQVWVELSGDMLIPVSILDNTFRYERQRYSAGEFIQVSFSFSFSDWFIPSLSQSSYVFNRTYLNRYMQDWFTKDDCGEGLVGSREFYSVPAGMFTSLISQADADNKAMAWLEVFGQQNANDNGECTAPLLWLSDPASGIFYKNDCEPGYGSNTPVTYTVPAGAYTSSISQYDANQQAVADLNANGQAYANSTGSCTAYTYLNVEQSQDFTKNDCDLGVTGSTVTYTVPAGTYGSFTSQADADNQALADIAANGQAYANATGTCLTTVNTITVESYYVNYGSTDEAYVKVHSSLPTNKNLRVTVNVSDGSPTVTTVQLYIFSGQQDSAVYIAGTYPAGDGALVSGTITGLSPTSFAGMSYTY